MIGFQEEIEQSLPKGLRLPDEFVRLFLWMEANGFVHQQKPGDRRCASLYREPLTWPASLITFQANDVDASFMESYTGNRDPAVTTALTDRLALFIRTGGDGSLAGIWKNDEGRQVFVHMGSGSGSTILTTLADNPVDMLRLPAIGYQELCCPEHFALTPAETAWDEDYRLPTEFRSWAESSLGVTIPATASEIIPHPADMGNDRSDDAFCRWIMSHCR